MIALRTQSGNDLHATENGGCVLPKLQLSPTRERPTTLYRVTGAASLPTSTAGTSSTHLATAAEHFREYGPAPIDGEPIALVFARRRRGPSVRDRSRRTSLEVHHASWFDDFVVTASSLQEFLEQLGRRIANQT